MKETIFTEKLLALGEANNNKIARVPMSIK